MLKRFSILFLLAFCVTLSPVMAQTLTNIEGKVVDKKSKEPVIGAAVHLKETDQWTVTNEHGEFIFKDVAPVEYTVEVQCLCYEFLEAVIPYTGTRLEIYIAPTSYDMEEVNVLAKKGSGITTTTTIGSAAIEHVQATGLSDVMQLLPGNLSENPDLSKPQQISIREIGGDNNTAMGTSILIDNAPISNDANLQRISTASSASAGFSSVAGGGVDLRQISSDNIESVEVIKGIPSVIYGDLTSGAVVVNTKAGYSPLSVRLKTDPKIKQVALTKGFRIPSTTSFLNFNVDYLSSFSDVLSKYKGYKRLTAQTAYSTTMMQSTMPLTFNAKLNIFGTVDQEKTDPDALVALEEYQSQDQGVRLNLNGKWSLNKKFLTDVRYTWSVSYSHRESYQEKYRSSSGGVTPISLSLAEGINDGHYLKTEELTELTIDEKPVSIFGQLTFNKIFNFKKGIINKVLAGADYRLNGNYGLGQIYDIKNPPYISNSSSRPRSFKEIPAQQTVSLYLEDKLIIPIRTTKLNLQAGARLNNYQPHSIVKSKLGYYFEPRFNLQYDILNNRNNDIFELLTLNAGIGKTYKAPPILYLYPDNAYYDFPILDYYVSDSLLNTSMFYTRIYNTDNPDLKPYENLKREAGIDFRIRGISGNITVFKEDLTNGFDLVNTYEFIEGYRYITDDVPIGEKPDTATLLKEDYEYIISYLSPVNSKKTTKEGIEYSINFGKIKALYTSFTIDGAYLKTERIESTIDYPYLPGSGTAEQFTDIGMYPAGESRVSERFNTNLRMVTQIPQLRLILSSTLQMVWFEKYYYPFYEEAPLYLFDRDGTITEYTVEDRTAPKLEKYYNDKSEFYYLVENLPPLFMANVRLSKEIEDKMKLSIFVNNFLNYRPMHQYVRSQSYKRRNSPIYFGAEITFKL